MQWTLSATGTMLALNLAGVAAVPEAPPPPDRALWEAVDIVPMPKRMRLTGATRPVSVETTVLVLGAASCEQSRIGAAWINRRLVQLGAEPLPMVTDPEPGDSRTLIMVGTRADNAGIDEAVAAERVNVGDGNPGARGYEIRFASDAKRIFLAGSDPIGALYACVTFAELLEQHGDGVLWREAIVRDWPDIIHMTLGEDFVGGTSAPEILNLFKAVKHSPNPSAELRKRFLDAMRAHYEQLLRWKVTSLLTSERPRGRRYVPTQGHEVLREAVEYGKARGIGVLLWSVSPFVGLVKDYPDLQDKALPPGRYPTWIRSWGMDAVRRETAENLAQFLKQVGFTDIGFHDSDTGWFNNPARWNERPEADRKRWGDDYVAATVHKHRIYYDALKRQIPDARMHVTVYPYQIGILDPQVAEQLVSERYGPGPAAAALAREYRQRYTTFWSRLHREMPADMTFCIRETHQPVVAAFAKLTPGRGAFTWYALMSHAWRPLFSEAPRWVGTFHCSPDDFVFTRYADAFVPLQSLAVREYTWNVDAPGAAPWARLAAEDQWRHSEPEGAIYEVVLPHIIRNLFGRAAAPEVTRAVSQNVEPRQIFDQPTRPQFRWLKTHAQMQRQADMAADGAAALDVVWQKCGAAGNRLGMDAYAFRRFVYLRELFHACKWMSAARAQNLLARESAKAQDLAGAEQAVAAGLDAVSRGRDDLQALLAERPEDPVLSGKDYNRWAGGWRLFMADWADLTPAEERLVQTRKEFAELGSLGAVPKEIVERLARQRIVRALSGDADVSVDGALDELVWSAAFPTETFFVWRKGRQIARAHTRCRMVASGGKALLGFSCWVPGGESPTTEDTIEIFLKGPGRQSDYVHFMIKADGTVRQQRNRWDPVGPLARWQPDNEWTCPGLAVATGSGPGRWTAEVSVPLAGIDLGPVTTGWGGCWRVNLCRVCPIAGEPECSSIQVPGAADFHDVKAFQPLLWGETVPHAGASVLEARDVSLATRTLPDRIATVASFVPEMTSEYVLHDVTLTAEAYDAGGKLQGRKALCSVERVFYSWVSPEPVQIEYLQEVAGGGLRLLLTADEGRVEQWVRFGGWAGTGDLGSAFAAGTSGGQGLSAPCFFPSVVPAADGRSLQLFSEKAGTVEFWLQPTWRGRWLPPGSKDDIRCVRHAMVQYGPLRRDYPRHTNNSPLSIQHYGEYGIVSFTMLTSSFRGGWESSAAIREAGAWESDTWHHVACVWDAAAARDDWMRIYIDGRKVAGLARVAHEERLGDDPSVRLDSSKPFNVQIGALNTGLCPADAVIDEFRISRRARYAADFEPASVPLAPDRDTSALFHFDGSLIGIGVAADGSAYSFAATPGVPAY